MTPHEILAALRAAGCSLRFDRFGQLFLTGAVAPGEALHAEFSAQRAAVADLLMRERLQPWRPGVCVVMAELLEIVVGAWPDADPGTIGLVADQIAVAVAVADFEAMASMGAA